MPSNVLQFYDAQAWTIFPDIIVLSGATAKYNCHSYAWYYHSTSNDMWMNDPIDYILDYSYEEVNHPVSGDIICYYDSYGNNIHSGIVVSYNSNIASNNICGDSNRTLVDSKWGAAGLYRHMGDYCPYAYQATTVKYYHRHTIHNYVDHYCVCGEYTPNHDFHAPYTILNTTQHQACCICSQGQNQPHVVSSSSFNHGEQFAYCLLCDGIASIGLINSFGNSNIEFITKNNSYILKNGVIVLSSDDLDLYFKGILKFIPYVIY